MFLLMSVSNSAEYMRFTVACSKIAKLCIICHLCAVVILATWHFLRGFVYVQCLGYFGAIFAVSGLFVRGVICVCGRFLTHVQNGPSSASSLKSSVTVVSFNASMYCIPITIYEYESGTQV